MATQMDSEVSRRDEKAIRAPSTTSRPSQPISLAMLPIRFPIAIFWEGPCRNQLRPRKREFSTGMVDELVDEHRGKIQNTNKCIEIDYQDGGCRDRV
jgi:hypothetical protein